MVLETYMTLFVTELDFPEKTFCSQNWENGPKIGLFEYVEKFGH